MFANLLLSFSSTNTSSVIFAHCSLHIVRTQLSLTIYWTIPCVCMWVCVRVCFSTSFHTKGYTTIALCFVTGIRRRGRPNKVRILLQRISICLSIRLQVRLYDMSVQVPVFHTVKVFNSQNSDAHIDLHFWVAKKSPKSPQGIWPSRTINWVFLCCSKVYGTAGSAHSKLKRKLDSSFDAQSRSSGMQKEQRCTKACKSTCQLVSPSFLHLPQLTFWRSIN